MNKKNKVLLTIMGLVVLSGIAATSSTFAWFTTVRSAMVSFSNATVETKENDLHVSYVSSLNAVSIMDLDGASTSAADGDTINNLIISGANRVTDISGDGLQFYKPVWKAANYGANLVADSIEPITLAAAGDADGYLVDFTLRIARGSDHEGTSGALKVYFDEGTGIFPKTTADADINAVAATRMAIIVDGVAIYYYAQNEETTYNYLTNTGDDTDVLYEVEEFTNTEELPDVVVGTPDPFGYEPTVTEAGSAGYVPFLTLNDATDTVDATFRFWIEGEDTDAINTAIGGVFEVVLKMYALAA